MWRLVLPVPHWSSQASQQSALLWLEEELPVAMDLEAVL
jgi:hypothetical protein